MISDIQHEETEEQGLPLIIDSHVHLWNPSRLHLPWLEEIPLLKRPYRLDDYEQATQGVPVAALVYIEVGAEPVEALYEARWINTLAENHPRIQGIVAAAPLEQGPAAQVHLQHLAELGPRIKGVRRNIQDEAPDFCLQEGFLQGVHLLPAYGFSCDLCLTHRQLPAVIELVRRSPETAFVLDHLGKPGIKGRQLDPWRQQIQELAALPNVWCKISGMVTEADHQHWQPDDLAPYIETVFDCFGADRVMFGSDWPVVLLVSSYQRWYETARDLLGQLSPDVLRKFWAENARRFYRLHTYS